MDGRSNAKIIQELRKFDTATICNVVATYPNSDICLKLYDPWLGEYYTDATLRCMYPELGPVCGYAATVWYSDTKSEDTTRKAWVLEEHLSETPKPTILVAKQSYSSPKLQNLSGLFGGMMTAEFKALGVEGVVTDGPMRDYVEIKEQNVQYLATGLTSSHGPFHVQDANIPLTVAGMTVTPGDIIHMDQCGACKFPAEKLDRVLEYAKTLAEREKKQKEFFQSSSFNLERMKELRR